MRVQASELFERRYDGSVTEVIYRIPTADGRTAAEVVFTPDGCPGGVCTWTENTRYLHDDHLGSGNLITDVNGKEAGGVSYDPWGRPRELDDWTIYLDNSSTDDTISGFTGHQAETEGGLINMRGRMYDPVISRFTSVDPIVAAPLSSQGWSPYSYVYNQPLSLTDPSGYAAEGSEPEQEGGWRCLGKRGVGLCWWSRAGTPDSALDAALVYQSLLGYVRGYISSGFNGPRQRRRWRRSELRPAHAGDHRPRAPAPRSRSPPPACCGPSAYWP